MCTKFGTSFILQKISWSLDNVQCQKSSSLSKKKLLKNFNLGIFFDNFNFKSILLLKWCPIFGDTVLFHRYRYKKKHFAIFDFLVKMSLVLDVVHINATTLIWLLKGELYNNAEKSVTKPNPCWESPEGLLVGEIGWRIYDLLYSTTVKVNKSENKFYFCTNITKSYPEFNMVVQVNNFQNVHFVHHLSKNLPDFSTCVEFPFKFFDTVHIFWEGH